MRRARHWDARLHSLVGGLPTSPADRWLRRLTTAADHGVLWMVVAAALVSRRGPLRRAAVRGLGSMAVSSTVVNAVLKRVFGRRRPDLGSHPVDRLLHRSLTTHSFPSGHASSAGAFATGVALESPVAGVALAPVALAVGYSRVHVGVHYPGDVVAGLAVGTAVAVGSQAWWRVRPTTPARVRPARSAPALPEGEGLVVAVNPRSGPEGYDPAEDVRRLLPRAEVLESDPQAGIGDLLEEAARSGRARALGVAGGDGSVAAAAAAAVEHGLALAVLPAGTLNHFARDVGVHTLEHAAEAVVAGQAVDVDVAEVNGTPFLNTASIGSYPEMVRRRDALAGRLGRWAAMTVAAATTLRRGTPVSLLLDGRPVLVWILFVGNGRYTPRGLAPAWRPRLEDGLLDVQYLRADVRFSRTRAVLGSLLGISDRSSGYASTQAREVRVVSRSGPQEIAYDGETGDPATEFCFRKRATLTVYCCRPD
ncbi:bifunctional phosphatase PAP2/diacylglycerol kinase family protein [Geodermatophilus sabuli]|uniref:Undecaprenyl-diphosphatase n=1 Tax=Geodermatophilus sabuli TaxID=1564158 RepID=A0A285ECV5_9ACTN|nr:phosphatase PAP2 family protein [Geodermatophilus sabuli]MBB3083596.1 undecaprenyl-diphosphatase [Geodermatophilus sabuli]SNX96683.1 undecaprenyl-diphosphatase [Geodermatophilus sabuli]